MAPSVKCKFMSATLKGLILTTMTNTSKELMVKNTFFFLPEFYFNYTELRNKQINEDK
jgi:hypothetical protein